MKALQEDAFAELGGNDMNVLEEEIAGRKMGQLQSYECPTCLLFERCALLEAMENEDGNELYDAIIENGECKVKKQLRTFTDHELNEYFLTRHWDE